MDQASSLRELMGKMNGKEKEDKAASVAFISMEPVENMNVFLKKLAIYTNQRMDKRICLMGIKEEKEFTLEDYIYRRCEIHELKRTLTRSVDVIHGLLDVIGTIRTSSSSLTKLIQLVEKVEQETDLLMYDAGNQINAVNVNISMAANQIVLVIKPTASSLQDALDYIKILFKMNVQTKIGVIVDSGDLAVSMKQYKKLQEIALSEFNYHIEMVGCFEFKYIPLFAEAEVFEGFNSDFFVKMENKRSFSESLLKMMP